VRSADLMKATMETPRGPPLPPHRRQKRRSSVSDVALAPGRPLLHRCCSSSAAGSRRTSGGNDPQRLRRVLQWAWDGPEKTLMSPRGGVNRRDDQCKLFLPKYLS
jgi:hypothetical protein